MDRQTVLKFNDEISKSPCFDMLYFLDKGLSPAYTISEIKSGKIQETYT